MSDYKLLKHKDFESTAKDLPPSVQRKTIWAQVLLGTRGRTPSVKGTMGRNARWRRTPVYGSHYYMWWIPKSESTLASDGWEGSSNGHAIESPTRAGARTILIHSIRHHDQTDNPINAGTLADYEDVVVNTLDPRYDEQHAISTITTNRHISLTTIKGLPGSGKTIALLYLLKDLIKLPGNGKIVYITYTSRLKRAAQEFIQAQHPDYKERIWICTLNEVTKSLTGIDTFSEPFREFTEFQHYLNQQDPTTLGQWRRYPQSLFTEIRAHLLGRDFPEEYEWANENSDLSELSAEKYANERSVDLPMAEIAYKIAARVRNRRFFRDQKAAYDALTALLDGECPRWLTNLDALVIDEVQDLTILQTALLCELLHVRMKQAGDTPLVFTVAGDESQIVQPSGFDWGLTKRMLGTQLGTKPEEFEFQHQRRAPYNLGRIIDNSWDFYSYLPKVHRPSGRRHTDLDENDDTETRGKVYLCPPPPDSGTLENPAKVGPRNPDWDILFYELADKPGRALIDLTENLGATLDKRIENSDEILFLPREIKGLERNTVLVNGLNDVFVRARQYTERPDETTLPLFEARRLFDEIRVALSRSTQTLILLDNAQSEVSKTLKLDAIEGVAEISWSDLLDILRTEEMSPIEIIEGYIQEVEDLLERSMWQQAYRRNRRAYDYALEIGDFALQQEADEQYLEACLQETAELIQLQQWDKAYRRNRKAFDFAQRIDDEVLLDSVQYQFKEIDDVVIGEVRDALVQVYTSRAQKQFDRAYSQAKKAHKLMPIIHNPKLASEVQNIVTETGWAWSEYILEQDDGSVAERSSQNAKTIIQLLEDTATYLEAEENFRAARAYRTLQQRYQELPQRQNHSRKQVESLLTYSDRFITLMQSVSTESTYYSHVQRWLDEIYAHMDLRADHFQRWAGTTQKLAATIGSQPFIERLESQEEQLQQSAQVWAKNLGKEEITQRYLNYFTAFAAGIRGEHALASHTWESLEEPALAAEQARFEGDIERAATILKQARIAPPDELAISMKLLRLMEQLENKHHGLSRAERTLLLDRLGHLQDAVASVGDLVHREKEDALEKEIATEEMENSQT